jgi:hypothetical protein
MHLPYFSIMKFDFFSTRILHTEKEKSKDYRNTVIIQVIIVIAGMVLSPFLNFADPSNVDKLIITLFSGFGALYAFLLWDLLKDFTNSRSLVTVVLIILFIITALGLAGEFPYYQILEIKNRPLYLFFLHGLLFPIEVMVIGYTIKDLFSGNEFTNSKLWGAACVYLMIGISFGSLYDLLHITGMASFGKPMMTLGLESYSESIYYSFTILGGLDSSFENASKLIRNIGVVEAVWGNLFAILIIGKLLSLPTKNPNQT